MIVDVLLGYRAFVLEQGKVVRRLEVNHLERQMAEDLLIQPAVSSCIQAHQFLLGYFRRNSINRLLLHSNLRRGLLSLFILPRWLLTRGLLRGIDLFICLNDLGVCAFNLLNNL